MCIIQASYHKMLNDTVFTVFPQAEPLPVGTTCNLRLQSAAKLVSMDCAKTVKQTSIDLQQDKLTFQPKNHA